MKDFERRMFVLMKRNQGWTFQRIGDKFGITREAVRRMYNKVKNTSVEALQKEYDQYLSES